MFDNIFPDGVRELLHKHINLQIHHQAVSAYAGQGEV